MAGEKHLYLVAKGGYEDSVNQSETWQTGIRLWCDLSVPDDQGTLPTTSDFTADAATDVEDDWTIESSWQWKLLTAQVIDPVSYLNDQAAPAWSDLMGAGFISGKVNLASLTLYPMLSTGKAFEGRSAKLTWNTPLAGGGASDLMPLEVATVASYRTAVPGAKGRGRGYLPPAGHVKYLDTGLLNGTGVGDLVTALATFLSALAVENVEPTLTHVRPIVTGGNYTKYGVITSVNVGNVPDAQRRRRRSLAEERTSSVVTYG
uniref:Uncharacterized protein n=1 Tax=uncultured prokaryote TaxID=198431 RepID=A0A0H5Q8R8_9ZZZZ|nr:hypothetical protein [uncultured prokaryote]